MCLPERVTSTSSYVARCNIKQQSRPRFDLLLLLLLAGRGESNIYPRRKISPAPSPLSRRVTAVPGGLQRRSRPGRQSVSQQARKWGRDWEGKPTIKPGQSSPYGSIFGSSLNGFGRERRAHLAKATLESTFKYEEDIAA